MLVLTNVKLDSTYTDMQFWPMGITPLCLGFPLRVGPISEISAAEILNDWEEVPFSKVLIQRNLRLTSVSQIRNSQFCPITPGHPCNPGDPQPRHPGCCCCKLSSGWTGPLQVIIRRGRPLANDHLDGRASCKWSLGWTASCK